jgi:hypothetical protein
MADLYSISSLLLDPFYTPPFSFTFSLYHSIPRDVTKLQSWTALMLKITMAGRQVYMTR